MNDPKRVTGMFVEELWNNRRLDLADSIFSPHCITHQLRSGPPVDAVPREPQRVKVDITQWIASFPDLRFSVEQVLSEGDRVAMQLLMEGTHRGVWMGISATCRKIQIRMFTVHRIAEGRIVEDMFQVNWLGVFQQPGIVPDTGDLLNSRRRDIKQDC